ncbi:proline-rich basic protein 1 [Perognathus longimembris pacificus]|uniref:proline-rich basic protein 1 n=1 Tax=Perognathus longimembris pacificus TaxID=214514 RepID=UPI0020188A83|nr:proline-rich basic protein 1 [Perognathus longimembris pacificus]
MRTALAPPALPGLPRRLPTAPARRQDSSGSSGSYHTAPGSPEPPDVGPDAGGPANWLWVAPGRGAGAQPLLSVSAQNSRQQPRAGSGFPRGPGSGPPPPRPQLRMLPSGEMEVIFGALPPCGRSDAEEEEEEEEEQGGPVRQLPAAPPRPRAPDGGSRWATYLEVRAGGPGPEVRPQFECVEVALEERAAPARPRTVPKRQIELRPRPPNPPRAPAPRPRLLLRTGSLDESLGRLKAAAGLVQTALARKLGTPAAPAGRSPERPDPQPQEAPRGPRAGPEDGRARPPRALHGSAPARAPRPWPSLRERAIRRDKPAPGTEPLGPVSSSIFLQSEEKTQEGLDPEPTPRSPRDTPDRTVTGADRSGAPKPRSPSPSPPPWQSPNGALRGPLCPAPQNLPPGGRTVWRVTSPSFPEASSAWGNRSAKVEKTVGRRSPSPLALSPWAPQGVAGASCPSPEAPCPWQVRPPDVRDGAGPSPPAPFPWEAPEGPLAVRSPSPQEARGPAERGSPAACARGGMNGTAGQRASPAPSPPGTPEATEARSSPAPELAELAVPGRAPSPEGEAPEPPPRGPLAGPLDGRELPEALGSGEAAAGRPRVALPRPRDVRKMVKNTYAPRFPAQPAPPAPPGGEDGEDGGAPRAQGAREPPGPQLPAPAHYTSVFLKDFLPVVPHPYEPPEPPLHTAPPDAPPSDGVPRRRAENSTAKPYARTEIRLPGALVAGPRLERTPGARGTGRGRPEAGAQRPVPDGGARALPEPPPAGTEGGRRPRPGSPRARPSLSPGIAPKLETCPVAPEPAAVEAARPAEPRAPAPPPQPRAASAPPTDGIPHGPTPGLRGPPGAPPPGKVLVDPESGRCYWVEAPRQPRRRLLFDPESGQYVEVLLPPSSPGPPRHVYTPLALGPGLYPPAYGPVSGLSLPPSPHPPALSSPQLPWASEAGPPEGVYFLPVSGTPSPAPPLLFCAPPPSSGLVPPSKGSAFPL